MKKALRLLFFFIQIPIALHSIHHWPTLDYSFEALEPHIDKETMRLHYEEQHKREIDELNAALHKYPELADKKIEELLEEWKELPRELKQIIRNNGGSYLNHLFFWRSMSPQKTTPSDAFRQAIGRSFGSLKEFQAAFIDAALKIFGSGWAWLCLNKAGELAIKTTANHDNPITEGFFPLLCIDLWEHAYYLKYHNDRKRYLNAWWNTINWREVERLHQQYMSEKKMQQPFKGVILIPGITGDLAKRKLIPALYDMIKSGMRGLIIGLGRQELTVANILEPARSFISQIDQSTWDTLCSMTRYFFASKEKREYAEIHKLIEQAEKEHKLNGQRIAYLALPPDVFCSYTEQLTQAGIIKHGNPRHVIVYEKPFGWSSQAADHINECIKARLTEEQIYRIDHYLAKGLVALLPSFCTSNDLIRRAWNNRSIKEISIIFDETMGMEGRGSFYDRYGALKDVVQNHMLQLLALLTLDESDTYDASLMQHKKAEFIRSLSIVEGAEGQYEGYKQEPGVNPQSATETAVILKLISNDTRWKGVSFVLRTGKALKHKTTEIKIVFNDLLCPSVLVFRITPQEEVVLNLAFNTFGTDKTSSIELKSSVEADDAYKRLLNEIMHGYRNSTVSFEEIKAQWQFAEKVKELHLPLITYQKGSTGPSSVVLQSNPVLFASLKETIL